MIQSEDSLHFYTAAKMKTVNEQSKSLIFKTRFIAS